MSLHPTQLRTILVRTLGVNGARMKSKGPFDEDGLTIWTPVAFTLWLFCSFTDCLQGSILRCDNIKRNKICVASNSFTTGGRCFYVFMIFSYCNGCFSVSSLFSGACRVWFSPLLNLLLVRIILTMIHINLVFFFKFSLNITLLLIF